MKTTLFVIALFAFALALPEAKVED